MLIKRLRKRAAIVVKSFRKENEGIKAATEDDVLVSYPSINFGCDPEFFFAKDGKVIGAEKVLPGDGITFKATYTAGYDPDGLQKNKFIIDGVQAELNPNPNPCRANLGNEIAACFRQLRAHLDKKKDVKVSFEPVIKVSRIEFDNLCEKSKVFGCAPSKNLYDKGATIKVNAAKYRRRSAGGHIHMGLTGTPALELLRRNPERLVTLMDILVGNTCVIIDRDPNAVIRRKVYGRAGEYRLPAHGVEYRTLSNFWLRSYQLMSMVMGLSRMAGSVLWTTLTEYPKSPVTVPGAIYQWDAEKDLLDRVDLTSIRKAINRNDLDLALKNFEGVKGFIRERVKATSTYSAVNAMAVSASTLPNFEHFCKKIIDHGLVYWFPRDPMEHWCSLPEGHGTGFESFMTGAVATDMKAVGAKF